MIIMMIIGRSLPADLISAHSSFSIFAESSILENFDSNMYGLTLIKPKNLISFMESHNK